MKSALVTFGIMILCVLFHVPRVQAQVLSTAENGGKGSQSVMISANAIQPKDFGTLSNFWIQYGRGMSNRIDAFAGYGNITVFGRSQSYAALGSNVVLLRRSVAGVDVSLYNGASIAINHRQEGSRILLSSALIASRPFKTEGLTITPYGGVNRLTPLIRPADSIFTPPAPVYSGIVGFSIPLSSAITFFVEFNPGSVQRSGGIGVLGVIPQNTTGGSSK